VVQSGFRSSVGGVRLGLAGGRGFGVTVLCGGSWGGRGGKNGLSGGSKGTVVPVNGGEGGPNGAKASL